ncbi:hypothetical protein Vadar_015794 [Vaccinium darrowii]|uniref:Uncharacterized protein n=1 Tax=Vaccinium darrowii TaxID=229202 RepID=A0ACB7XR05_9ERIC|nr:hypothetical protein Vadar_015794 [Vaccinium darrowii]
MSTREKVKKKVQEKSERIAARIEHGFDKAHHTADRVLWPLAPIDAVVHGTARGIKNWLCDEHPKKPDCHDKSDSDDSDESSQSNNGSNNINSKGNNNINSSGNRAKGNVNVGNEDEDFTANLVSDGVFVVSVDDFEGVELSGWAVDDFVDCAAAADSVESFQRREIQRWCAGERWGQV